MVSQMTERQATESPNRAKQNWRALAAALLICHLAFLPFCDPAHADAGFPPPMYRDAANALLPAARNNLGLVPSISSGILPSSIALGNAGSGYAIGDTITLTCSGCTFAANPLAIVSAVSGGAVTTFQMTLPGAISQAPANSLTFTQSATSGAAAALR
jgi:hypothetical protein